MVGPGRVLRAVIAWVVTYMKRVVVLAGHSVRSFFVVVVCVCFQVLGGLK